MQTSRTRSGCADRLRRSPTGGWPLALLATFCVCAGCAAAAPPALPEIAPGLPASFTRSPSTGDHDELEWWRAFADPVLDQVLEAVLTSNFDLSEALARVQQARVRGRLAEAVILPSVQARAGADTFDTPTNAGIGAQLRDLGLDEALEDAFEGATLPDRLGLTSYTVGADFAYEIDLWGRVRHASLAAGAELLASESDAQTVRIGILAETITAYFDIVDARRQIAIGRESLALLEERERLAATRYERGLTDWLTLDRARDDRRDAQARLPQLDSTLAEAEARLAVLLGGYPRDVAAILPEALSPTPVAEPVPPGLPVDLLLQRPDVQAAERRLQAAGHDVEARRAELMPSLSFSGSIGLQSIDATGLFNVQQWFGNLLANLLVPVFDGDRLAANVALAHARFDELAAAYGRTVVTAVNEVEAALAELRNEARHRALLAARREEAQEAWELRLRQYATGLTGYAEVLDASRTLLRVESALAGSERDMALVRLAVHRALGGAWTAPDPAAPQPTAL